MGCLSGVTNNPDSSLEVTHSCFVVTTLSSLVELFGCCFRDEGSVKTFQLIDRLEI